jgi:hypothetical protein
VQQEGACCIKNALKLTYEHLLIQKFFRVSPPDSDITEIRGFTLAYLCAHNGAHKYIRDVVLPSPGRESEGRGETEVKMSCLQ